MAKYIRGSAYRSAEVSVSADEFWKVLRDWGAVMKWAPPLDADPPAPVSGCELREGHSVDQLPCTRLVYLESDGSYPPFLEETLLYADEEAKFIYYNVEGVGVAGMRNYLATTTVDEVGPDRCRITCSSRFDVPEGGPVQMITDFLEAVYDRSVIQGMTKVALADRAPA